MVNACTILTILSCLDFSLCEKESKKFEKAADLFSKQMFQTGADKLKGTKAFIYGGKPFYSTKSCILLGSVIIS